jgi:hypothetical protein
MARRANSGRAHRAGRLCGGPGLIHAVGGTLSPGPSVDTGGPEVWPPERQTRLAGRDDKTVRSVTATATMALSSPPTSGHHRHHIRSLVLSVHAVSLSAVYAGQVRGWIQPDHQSPVWCWPVD